MTHKNDIIIEPVHEISNNVVCATSKASLEFSMIVKLLTEHHLKFLSLKCGCTGSSASTLVKMHIVGNLMPRLICISEVFLYNIDVTITFHSSHSSLQC